MVASRHFHLRFFQGSYLADDANYGAETYGEDPYTYGQQGTQSTLSGTSYELLPSPGWHPQIPAWVYRLQDTTDFSCLVVDQDDPTSQVNVSTIVEADVILTEQRFDSAKAWKRGFPLTLDIPNNALVRSWLISDLIVAGRFRVTVRILFESGRYMTVEAQDGVWLQVNDAVVTNAPVSGGLL